MYAFAVTAANRNDEVKLSGAFAKLTDEDPGAARRDRSGTPPDHAVGSGRDPSAGGARPAQAQVQCRGRTAEAPRTPYRETIRKGAQAHGRHKKQSGGHGQFGDVKLEIRPRPAASGFQFENKVVGGAVPRQFIPAVEAGAREHLQRGPLGFAVVDVASPCTTASSTASTATSSSFKLATGQALKEGLPQCDPVLLEPILA